jgi:VWFA-related protein
MRKISIYVGSLALAAILGVSAVSSSLAQSGGVQIKITQVDNSQFPRVTVYVSVTNTAGEPVGVDPSTIQLLENGKPVQAVEAGGGGQGGVGPLSTMLVMDVSGSMAKNGKIDGARAAATAYVNQMRPGDQAGLMVYNTKTRYVQTLTTDHKSLLDSINSITTSGDTAMYDALIAAEEALKDVPGRKAIIAVTDGLDNSSSHNNTDVIAAIGPSGLSISTIGLGDATSKEQVGLDETALRSLAQQAGGGYSFAGDAQSLSALFQSYGRELQNEYAITYVSPLTLRDGVNRSLTVAIQGAQASAQVQYNPGGVLPEVASQSWVLFGAILLGLVALLVAPLLFGLIGKGGRPARRKSRVKLVGGTSGPAPSMARGRIKIK